MKQKKEKKMKNIIVAALLAFGLASNAHASMRIYNSSGTNLGNFTDMKLSTGLSVSQVSGKAQVSVGAGTGATTLYGFLQNRISTTGSRTLTYAECGSTVTNDGIVTYTLPSISGDAIQKGCRFTFIVGNGVSDVTYMKVKPTAGEQILLLTNKQGDAISADANGESVIVESLMNLFWAPVAKEQGTWVDTN